MKINIFYFLAFSLLLSSCDDHWLEVKRDISLTIPSSLDDVRALLNNNLLRYDNIGLAELSGGEYGISDAAYNARSTLERNGVIWAKDLYEGASPIVEWNNTYQEVLQCNIALEALDKLTPGISEFSTWNILYGEALFFRAKAFFDMVQLFSAPYELQTLDKKEGIPLRLSADINEKTTRASLRKTYDQILQDLTTASFKLAVQPLDVRQTSKPAAFAALARCYLVMRDYEKAGKYADSALQINTRLIDYNTINTLPTYTITPYNEEVILSATLLPVYGPLNRNIGFIPSYVYERYASYDCRKTVFFIKKTDGTMGFRGSYMGSAFQFQGSTSSEMLLVRAECSARAGNTNAAMNDLNTLLAKRYDPANFTPLSTASPDVALDLVLLERKKELIGRGLRWMDLRRLNLEPGHEETLSRTVNGLTYTLPPNDPRYVLPIPDYIVQATGISQNVR